MAALYLHHALFANDPPSPPSLAHASSHSSHHYASPSSVTLPTSTSEHSHPTEPLLHGPYPQAAAYQDILASQPVYSEASRTSWTTGLSLSGDPVTSRERRRQWERRTRRKLRSLRWAKRVLKGVIAAWAVYNTVRYFVAFTVYTTRDRQIALLVLGTAAALSFASLMLSILLSLFVPHLGWKHRSRSSYTRIQALLTYTASLLILGPAIVNGRCHWDIDVLWTGTGFECDVNHAVSWGAWLAGSVVRLIFTAVVLVAYHCVSYSYFATRMPSRRWGGRTHSHSISNTSAAGTLNSHSTRSLVTMLSTATTPVSAHPVVRQTSSCSDSDFTHESGVSVSRPRKLRRSQSRISADRLSSDGRPRLVRPSSTDRSQIPSDGHAPALRFADELEFASGDSSGEELFSPRDGGGSPLYGILTGASSPGASSSLPPPSAASYAAEPSRPFSPDDDVQGFVDQFRALVEQVSLETEAGIELAENDDYSDHSIPFPESPMSDGDGTDYVPVMGKLIQRMPTIESLGSREVMSLASASAYRGDRSVHTLSRPPTRANTLSLSEAAGSPSVSRSNSLTASIVLASPVEAPSPTSEHMHGGIGSRNTASYYTASGPSTGVDSAVLLGRDAEWAHHEQ